MPRLSPSLLRRAAQESLHLRSLLAECRDLPSARNELRWLTEHTNDVHRQQQPALEPDILASLIKRRARGEPLQYILGNQPFGDLEILCRKGVLIPRSETETYTHNIASLVRALRQSGKVEPSSLRILDLCTGTGCIALLLHSLLRPVHRLEDSACHDPQIVGIDISTSALNLANQNISHNISLGLLNPTARQEITFHQANILDSPSQSLTNLPPSQSQPHSHPSKSTYDILISNPPYISPSDYSPGGRTIRSVRKHEPKLALVPPPVPKSETNSKTSSNSSSKTSSNSHPAQADIFYPQLLAIAGFTQAKLICMEVGDRAQAERVASLASATIKDTSSSGRPSLVEIWCDDGSTYMANDILSSAGAGSSAGFERAVVVWRGSWARWREEQRNRTSDVKIKIER